MSCGKNSGVTNGGQMSFTQEEAKNIAAQNEQQAEKRLEYLRNELPQTSPVTIPKNASIKDEHKNGYDQVKYTWSDNGYNYEGRWHTHTPGAPEYSQGTWVIERVKPGIGAGKNHRTRIHEYLIKGHGWVSQKEWGEAKAARQKGTETKKQRELLDNGHWNAKK